jgi:hypothetical protein
MPPDGHAHSYEQGRMQGFAAALLRHAGALVDPVEPEGLEVLAPPEVQQTLGVGEFCRLGFGAALPQGAQRVGIEGDWLEKFARLLGPQGLWTRRVLAASARSPGDPERVLGHELVLDNATYRLLNVSPAWTRLLVLDFRASAVSDDKRDFILRLGVNLATGHLQDSVLTALAPLLEDPPDDSALPEDAALPEAWERERLLGLVGQALPLRLEVALAPFVHGLRRRVRRDQDRLHGYYNDLHREALIRAATLPRDDPKRLREEQRAAAIGHEYRAKLDDLARQYATRVTVEWVQTMELVMPVHRFTVQVRRRKAERTIRLDWNQAARRLESPSCEYGWGTERPRLVCDDAVHLVVPAGLAPCGECNRGYCRACHPQRCPKCGAGEVPRGGLSGLLRI